MKLSKTNLILIITILVLAWLYFAKEDVISVKTVTKYDTITNTIDNTKPTQIKRIIIKTTDTIKENDTVTKIVYKDKEVKEYKYKDSLKNGVVNETIIADNIYKRDIKLTTFNETKTITKTVVKSALYLGGTITSDFDKSINNASLNAYYTHKNKFLITTGLGYGIKTDKPNVNVGIAIKF